MRKYRLTADQAAANTGFTDLCVLTYSDLLTAVDDAAFNVALVTLNKGDVVLADTMLEIVTPLGGTITGNTAKLSVGRTSSAYTDILAVCTIATTGTAAAAGVAFGTAVEHQAIASDSTVVYCQLTTTAGTTHYDGLTAGEFRIWMRINRKGGRDLITA
jgi:hypothetical protein